MSTIFEMFTGRLESSGMLPREAKDVMELVVEQSRDEENLLYPMQARWHDDVTDYPPQLFAATRMTIKRVALAWIDEHCPQAWYRSMVEELD